MVEAATKNCAAPQPPAPPAAGPNFDALAISLTAQSNAISHEALWLTALGIIIAVVAIIGGIAWAKHVRSSAKDAAREAAEEEIKKIAPDIMNAWLTTEGLAALRQASQMAQPTTTTEDVADDIASRAGDE